MLPRLRLPELGVALRAPAGLLFLTSSGELSPCGSWVRHASAGVDTGETDTARFFQHIWRGDACVPFLDGYTCTLHN